MSASCTAGRRRKTRLLLVGFGTVGQGLAELLIESRARLAARDLEMSIVAVADLACGNALDPDGLDPAVLLDAVAQGRIEHLAPCEGSTLDLIAAAPVDVVVEATPTVLATAEPATAHILLALRRGLHVVTTNKGPIARFVHSLERLADERGVRLLYEGTVLSGTPLLSLARQTLGVAEVRRVRGVVNGTCNYVLTRMESGATFERALAEAQAAGYAETVPDADIEGLDSLAKLTILANALLGGAAMPEDFPCAGIAGLERSSVAEELANGRHYKLLIEAQRTAAGVVGSVGPVLLDRGDPLAAIRGVTNGVSLTVDSLGEVMVTGPGAGRRETGAAVLADLIAIATGS